MFVDYLKANHPHIKKLIYCFHGCGGQHKNYKNFMDLCSQKHDFGISAEWVFFATSYCKSTCNGIGGTVKPHLAKQSIQRSLNNQSIELQYNTKTC